MLLHDGIFSPMHIGAYLKFLNHLNLSELNQGPVKLIYLNSKSEFGVISDLILFVDLNGQCESVYWNRCNSVDISFSPSDTLHNNLAPGV